LLDQSDTLLFANTLDDWSWDCCCKHLAQLISRLLLQTPCSTDLKTVVVNTLLNWSWDCCCKHLAQLILRLLLQTPCSTNLQTAVTNTLHTWSWRTVLITCCSKCLTLSRTVLKLAWLILGCSDVLNAICSFFLRNYSWHYS